MTWTDELEQHLAVLRRDLAEVEEAWPQLAEEAGVAVTFVRGFVRGWAARDNPRLQALIKLGDAVERYRLASAVPAGV